MHRRMTTLGLMGLLAGLGMTAAQAQTQSQPARPSSRNRKPPVDKGPGETRAERDKRLQRECKGRPNAGACEGYGS